MCGAAKLAQFGSVRYRHGRGNVAAGGRRSARGKDHFNRQSAEVRSCNRSVSNGYARTGVGTFAVASPLGERIETQGRGAFGCGFLLSLVIACHGRGQKRINSRTAYQVPGLPRANDERNRRRVRRRQSETGVAGLHCSCGLSVLSVNCASPHLIVVVGDSLGFRCGEKCGDSMHAHSLPAASVHNHFRV